VSCLLAAVTVLILASTAEAGPWSSTPNLDRATTPAIPVGFGCKIIDRKLVCGKDVGDDDDDDDDDDGGAKEQNKDQENKKKTGNICEGEVACPPGYVVLDKPNKYGACCEPKEGFPPTQAEKCKFPGEVGTPPDCHCPEGTEFLGYKGCVTTGFKCVVKYWEVGPAQDLTYDYTGIGSEIQVRGELSKEMDLRKYHAKGPVTCTKVYYR
jgi:hypothetical protein